MPINTPTRKPNQAGTGFTNLQRVLQANKANKLGATVGAGIQQAGQQAVGAIAQAGNQFKSETNKEKERQSGLGQTVRGTLGGDLQNVDDQTVSKFETARSGQSKGPTGIIGQDKLAEQAREAQSLGQATGAEGGRLGLLQRFVGGSNRYTGGQQRLDNLLLGQTGQKDLTQSRRGTFGLNSQVTNQANAAREVGKELQSGAQNLKNETIGQLQTSISGYDQAMKDRAVQSAADREARVKEILAGDLNVEKPVYDQLLEAGLTGDRVVYNTELNDFIKANNDLATNKGVQEQTDFNKVQALAKLSAQDLGEKQSLLNDYAMSKDDVGSFTKSNMFKTPSQIALEEGIMSKTNEYAGKKASTDESTRAATSNLIAESPWGGSGGVYGSLLNMYSNPASFAQNRLSQLYQVPNRNASQDKELQDLTLAMQNATKGNVDTALIQKYMPSTVSSAPQGRIGPLGATSADMMRGSEMVQSSYGQYMPLIEEAKAKLYSEPGNKAAQVLQAVQIHEQRLKDAEAEAARNKEFYRVNRALKLKPSAT